MRKATAKISKNLTPTEYYKLEFNSGKAAVKVKLKVGGRVGWGDLIVGYQGLGSVLLFTGAPDTATYFMSVTWLGNRRGH